MFGSKALTVVLVSLLICRPSTGWAAAEADLHLVTFEAPPYIFPTSEGEPGLAIRLVEALMQRAGVSYDVTIMPPKRAIAFALSTPNTCVFPVERSQDREVQLAWISPILISRQGFFQNPKKPAFNLRVLTDVQTFKIGSYLGSGTGEYLSALGFDVDFAVSNNSNILKLMANRIDVWESDILSAPYIAAQAGVVLQPSELVFFTTLRAIGCHLGLAPERLERLNLMLQKMYQDGSFEKIRSDFEQSLAPKLSPTPNAQN